MSTAYVVVTLLGAALVAFSAGSVFAHAEYVCRAALAPVVGSLALRLAA
jgi:hypothetical protein